jgi:hypothetical protein
MPEVTRYSPVKEIQAMMSSAILLKSARAKLDRAVQQFAGLQDEFLRFIESKPYRVVCERDADADEWVIVQYPERDFPETWAVVLGEVLYDLRSALDHAIYELTILNCGTELDGTEFPVFSDEARFRDKKKGTGEPTKISGLYRIRGLTKKTQAVIESLQPFSIKNAPAGHLCTVALLNEMSNIDKHRALHICRRRHSGNIWQPTRSMPFTGEVKLIVGGDANQRAELFRWPCSGASPDEMGMNAEMHFDIAFDEGSAVGFIEPQPIVLICNQLIRRVRTILDQLEESVS